MRSQSPAVLSVRGAVLLLFCVACSSPATSNGPDMAADLAMACQGGSSCAPANACHVGRVDCTTGTPLCVDTGELSKKQGCGPLAYWPFDGDGRDAAAGRDLKLEGNPGFAQGLFGQALDLKGDGNTYAIRRNGMSDINDAEFDIGNADFTVQAWVAYHVSEPEQVHIQKFSGSGGPGWTFTKLKDQRVHVCIEKDGCSALSSNAQTFYIEQWCHYVFRKSTSNYEIFLNGMKIAAAPTPPVQGSSNPLLIGRTNFEDGRVFSLNGRIDEVAIWRRVLTDQEISFLSNGGAGRKASEVN